ncbi:hypothetical protein P2L35_14140, partial [Enterococcus faecium]|uniref:hypothetical protein n=1 Tax=Enterococcus faecium TaxID=1352 RepID=UPI0025B14CCE
VLNTRLGPCTRRMVDTGRVRSWNARWALPANSTTEAVAPSPFSVLDKRIKVLVNCPILNKERK